MNSTMVLAATLIGLVPGATTVEAEAREILDELLRVDTSHGNESVALRPIAARLTKAGIPVEIAEGSPRARQPRTSARFSAFITFPGPGPDEKLSSRA